MEEQTPEDKSATANILSPISHGRRIQDGIQCEGKADNCDSVDEISTATVAFMDDPPGASSLQRQSAPIERSQTDQSFELAMSAQRFIRQSIA